MRGYEVLAADFLGGEAVLGAEFVGGEAREGVLDGQLARDREEGRDVPHHQHVAPLALALPARALPVAAQILHSFTPHDATRHTAVRR